MKKIFLLIGISLVLGTASFSQTFQATLVTSSAPNNDTLKFYVKPNANITTDISYFEFAFRVPTASTPSFTVNNLTSNTAAFPAGFSATLAMSFLGNYSDATYTYYKYVFNTGTIAPQTYIGGTPYLVFSVTLDSNTVAPHLDLVSNSVAGNYEFGMLDGGANLISAAAGTELYGPGEFVSGNDVVVPLTNVSLPVKFINFSATPKDGNAQLNWTVANEGTISKNYEVERSTDNGANFVTLDTIAITNPIASSNSYAYTDANLSAVKSASNSIEYVIKQVDIDGTAVTSQIATITYDNNVTLDLSVSPNPVQNLAKVKFNLDEEANVTVSLTDLNGRILSSSQSQGVKGSNEIPLNLSAFTTGNYMVRVTIGTAVHSLPLVKTN